MFTRFKQSFIHCQEVAKQQDQSSKLHEQSNETGFALVDADLDTKHQSKDKNETSNSITLKEEERNNDADSQSSDKVITWKKQSKTQRVEEETRKQSRSKLVRKGKIKDSKTSSGEIEDLDIQLEAETQVVPQEEAESQKASIPDRAIKTTRKLLQDDLGNQEIALSSQENISSSPESVGSNFSQDSKLQNIVKELSIEEENKAGKNSENSEVILRDIKTEDVVAENRLAGISLNCQEEDNSLVGIEEKVTSKTKRIIKTKNKSQEDKDTIVASMSTDDNKSIREDSIQNVEEEMFQNNEGKEYTVKENEAAIKKVTPEGKGSKVQVKKSETSDAEIQYLEKDENEDSTREKAIRDSDDKPSEVVDNKASLEGELKRKSLKVKKAAVKKEAEISDKMLHVKETDEKIQEVIKPQSNKADKETKQSLKVPIEQTVTDEPTKEKSDAFVDTAKENENRKKSRTKPIQVLGKEETVEAPSEEIMEPVKEHQDEIVHPKATENESLNSQTGEKIQPLHKEDDKLLDNKDSLGRESKKGLKLKKRKIPTKKEEEEEDTMMQDQNTDQDKQKTQKVQSIITSNKVPFFHFVFNQFD